MMTRSAGQNGNVARTASSSNGNDAGAVRANGSNGEPPAVLLDVTNTPTKVRRSEHLDSGDEECLTTAATATAVGYVRRESKKPKTEGEFSIEYICS